MKELFYMVLIIGLGWVNLAALEIGLAYDDNIVHHIEAGGDSYYRHDLNAAGGVSPYIELLTPGSGSYKAGIGLEYQIPRNMQDKSNIGEMEGWFSFLPIYWTNKISTPLVPNLVDLQLVGNLGYNFFFAGSDYLENSSVGGDICYGVGAGLHILNVVAQILYKVNKGTVTGHSNAHKITNKQLGFSIGWRTPENKQSGKNHSPSSLLP